MSTRSSIAILNADGSVDSIYNHSDSYPDWLGKQLVTNYNSTKAAKSIIKLGDASFIDSSLDSSIFYKRDMNRKDTEALTWKNKNAWLKAAPDKYWADFLYLWDGIKWICWNYNKRKINLYS